MGDTNLIDVPCTKLLPMNEVNRLDYEDFIEVFGNVIEHCPLCAAAVWKNRPFRDVTHLSQEFGRFIDALPVAGQEGILRCHPDLAGRLAGLGQLTDESTREQKEAGLNTITQQERETMITLNAQYRKQFGFPFVICARLNKKEAILQGLETRLKNNIQDELSKGIAEVKKIGDLRIQDLVQQQFESSRL